MKRADNGADVAMSLLQHGVPLRLLIDLATDADTLQAVLHEECLTAHAETRACA